MHYEYKYQIKSLNDAPIERYYVRNGISRFNDAIGMVSKMNHLKGLNKWKIMPSTVLFQFFKNASTTKECICKASPKARGCEWSLAQICTWKAGSSIQTATSKKHKKTQILKIAPNTFQFSGIPVLRLLFKFLWTKSSTWPLSFETFNDTPFNDQATLLQSSSLLQLELSYLLDGQWSVFMPHIPAVPKCAILRLLCFHSFTLVYQDTAFLPSPEKDSTPLSETLDLLSLEIN